MNAYGILTLRLHRQPRQDRAIICINTEDFKTLFQHSISKPGLGVFCQATSKGSLGSKNCMEKLSHSLSLLTLLDSYSNV